MHDPSKEGAVGATERNKCTDGRWPGLLLYCFSQRRVDCTLPAKIREKRYAAEEQIYVRQVDCTLRSTFSTGTVSSNLVPFHGHSSRTNFEISSLISLNEILLRLVHSLKFSRISILSAWMTVVFFVRIIVVRRIRSDQRWGWGNLKEGFLMN